MPQNEKALFRKSLGGFKKKDVNSYIESLNRKFTDELGSEKVNWKYWEASAYASFQPSVVGATTR